jgi:hypothetical protein
MKRDMGNLALGFLWGSLSYGGVVSLLSSRPGALIIVGGMCDLIAFMVWIWCQTSQKCDHSNQ